ncbi:ABC transporter permease [Homoserinibacter sp. GY 40078]|uniref:ABC transporter permease n=1 Tax=Homoserinibacter sp. GY 40078 TaxID=2603275 RepID=UPI0011CAA563|nr:ABC transporter permease [Homoserinibacter sp. GY 40078]TXK18862.1 ABC transporter permease [Homoserinibacter sp. GY 40078]
MNFLRYLSFRLLGIVIVLLIIAVVTFALFYLLPSDPARLACGRPCTDANLEKVREYMGVDQPWFVQLVEFLKGILFGRTFGSTVTVECDAPCFGYSFLRNASVTDLIAERFPATASIALGAAILFLVTGVLGGLIASLRRNSVIDRGIMVFSIAGISTPVYLAGILVILIIGFTLRWLPTSGYVPFEDSPIEWFSHLILPWVAVAIVSAAVYARLTRSEMLEVMSLDYIRTARAKGLSEGRVIARHGLRTALLPVVTVFGLDLGVLLGGAVITERVFAIPGMGSLLIEAVGAVDIQLIVGLTMFAAFLVVTLNLVIDLVYGLLDPRVRMG